MKTRCLSLVLAAALAGAGVAFAQPVLITSPTTINPGDTLVGGVPLATAQITVRGTTLTINGRQSIASLALERNGATPATVTHAANFSFTYGPGDVEEGMYLTVSGNVTIQGTSGGVASSIDVSGRGYPAASGPGAGTTSTNGSVGGAGAGYGGKGSSAQGFAGGGAYGSISQPVNMGSGGGHYLNSGSGAGGAGGGKIHLAVSGVLTVDGSIIASGLVAVGSGGSGSGGAVYLSADSFSGAGSISASGANGGSAWGSGGGGRIAIYYNSSTFSGTTSATGGTGSNGTPTRAGAGTQYFKAGAAAPDFKAINVSGSLGAATPVGVDLGARTMTIGSAANVVCSVGQTISSDVMMSTASRLEILGTNTVGGNFTMTDSSTVLTHTSGAGAVLTVSGNMTVNAGAQVNLDAVGFAPTQGPGAGTTSNNGSIGGAGAAHGGNGSGSGGFAGGIAYDTIDQPTMMGSGGGNYLNAGTGAGGVGGGALKLTVSGTLTNNGTISANGQSPASSGGAGAGGSLWITAGTLTGNGAINANGANGGNGWGPSGGGRIAMYYTANTYAGTISATGGTGGNGTPTMAGAGTVYQKLASDQFGSLTIINPTGTRGAATPITVNLSPALVTLGLNANAVCSVPQTFSGAVNMTNNARLELTGINSIATSLSLSSAATVLTHTVGQPLTLSVTGDCTIGAGSMINLNAVGFGATQGPGAGTTSNNGTFGGAGAGHGGNGCAASAFPGGAGYGSILMPITMGSGGGHYLNSSSGIGGAGGGAMHLTVGNTLTILGTITANGQTPSSSGGGGSAGSIWLTTHTLAGNGSIRADGANGGNSWGSGGGGRIAVYFDSSTYSGTMSATGGTGGNGAPVHAGAGTIITKRSADAFPSLTVDNASGALGAPTPIAIDVQSGLTSIKNSANAVYSAPQTFSGDLALSGSARAELNAANSLIGNVALTGTGNLLTHTSQVPMTLSVTGNVTVDVGSSISASALGYPAASGPGAGQSSNNGGIGAAGGGYGGRGGNAPPFQGGGTYGSLTAPVDLGSGGGNYVNSALGGSGGGAIRLSVGQVLTVNGSIAANGGLSNGSGGGGSGGSLYITAGQLAGTGTVQANGANGGGNSWGQGGGGRIAVYCCNITMALANISANHGASGSGPGANGTVYFGSSGVAITQQPIGGDLNSGGFTQLHVEATGSSSLTYHWRRRNAAGEFVNLTEGQNDTYFNVDTNTLFIQGIDCSGGGDFDVLICDTCGCFPSDAATIGVLPTGDYNHDGGIDGADVDAFFHDWEAGDASADVNEDGGIDGADVGYFFLHWEAGC